MNNLTFLQIQTVELRRLLEDAKDDPIMVPQLRVRLDEAEKALDAISREQGCLLPTESPILPRAAVFLRGGGVQGSEGIRPSLAGEALIQYERMFVEQALHDERLAAKTAGRARRPRGATTPGLLFTGTPRGSFGLEFVPQMGEDDSLLAIHANSLVNVADALIRVAESSAMSLDEIVEGVPPRVLQPLKQFLRVLALNGAELRFAFPDRPSRSLSGSQIRAAADLLERDIHEETIVREGTFRGVTRESGYFDLLVGEELITGTVADQLTEEDLEQIDRLTNQQCVADLQRTTVRKITGVETTSYVLLKARMAESASTPAA
jgi:hypothetical protein